MNIMMSLKSDLWLMDQTVLLKPVGVEFRRSISASLWQEAGAKLMAEARVLSMCNDRLSWWLGDWLCYGDGKKEEWGEKYDQAMAITNRQYQTLANKKAVAKAVEFSRRREQLSFSHHAEVTGLSASDQDEWLQKAIDQGWSVVDLRKAIRGELAEVKALPERVQHSLDDVTGSFMRWCKSQGEPAAMEEEQRLAIVQKLDRHVENVMEYRGAVLQSNAKP